MRLLLNNCDNALLVKSSVKSSVIFRLLNCFDESGVTEKLLVVLTLLTMFANASFLSVS